MMNEEAGGSLRLKFQSQFPCRVPGNVDTEGHVDCLSDW